MDSPSYEARLLLALKALKANKNLSIRAIAKIYNISRTTLTQRRDGRTAFKKLQNPIMLRNQMHLENQVVIGVQVRVEIEGEVSEQSHQPLLET